MKFSRWGKTPKDPPRRAKRKEIEGQAILTLELLTMERQTEPPINPKKKREGEKKGKIKTLPWLVSALKEKKEEKKERKTYLKEEEMGDAAVHNSPEKNHGQRKLKTGEREVSQKK